MATFKATIFKDRQREDKTWSVFIRFTHNRKVRYIPTSLSVSRKDITTTMRIKNQLVIDRCEAIISTYRKRVFSLGLEVNDLDIDTIVKFLQKLKDENEAISFTSYFYKYWCKEHEKLRGLRNYRTAFNTFKVFIGHENILHTEVTAKALARFCEYLSDRPRAQSSYTSALIRVFNDMRDYYNDEDNGIIRIKQSLSKFKVPKQNIAEKRALTITEIRNIFALPYEGKTAKGKPSRHDMALDCFRLSFCLMGMNSADLYNATVFDGENIVYDRTKTKSRRADKAKMVVRVHPLIRPIMDKYKGDFHVFSFSERYRSMALFNRAINIGLKEVGKEIGIDRLQFYSARHSFATIAANDAMIPIYIVNEMLCHVDTSLKTTMLYIKKDYSIINNENFKLLEFVLRPVVMNLS